MRFTPTSANVSARPNSLVESTATPQLCSQPRQEVSLLAASNKSGHRHHVDGAVQRRHQRSNILVGTATVKFSIQHRPCRAMATGEHRGLPAHQGSHLSVGARPLNGHVLGVTQYGARIFALLILKLATEQLSHFTRGEGSISLHEHGLRSQGSFAGHMWRCQQPHDARYRHRYQDAKPLGQ